MNTEMKFYWRLLLRRLPAMTALFLLCAGIGVALAVKLPTTYTANATLLVEEPQIPQNLAESTIRTGPSEQLEVIRRRLMTRANLIDIANKFKVFKDQPGMSPDEVVQEMRQRTDMKSKGKPLVMTITFSASEPRTAANVVNEYITLMLDANVRLRTGQAEETLDFFKQEVTKLDEDLAAINERILRFRNENADALPDNLEYRLNRQSNLQERIGRLEREKSSLVEQRAQIVAVFEETGRVESQQTEQLTPQQQELQKLEKELENGLAIYSETNPRIRVLQSRIEGLRTAIAAEGGASADATKSTQQALYEVTLAEMDSRMESIDDEIRLANEELEGLQDSISRTPENGIALSSLQRDYANVQAQYNSAVARLATARIGERIELNAKGQRVSVVENASVPSEPTSPNRPMLAAAGIGGGLAAAIGLFILLELLNTTVRRPAEVTRQTGTAPLATIPYIETKTHRRVRRGARVALMLVVVVGVPAALWAIDTFYQPLELIVRRVMSSFGTL